MKDKPIYSVSNTETEEGLVESVKSRKSALKSAKNERKSSRSVRVKSPSEVELGTSPVKQEYYENNNCQDEWVDEEAIVEFETNDVDERQTESDLKSIVGRHNLSLRELKEQFIGSVSSKFTLKLIKKTFLNLLKPIQY